jgi:hypothetical protein
LSQEDAACVIAVGKYRAATGETFVHHGSRSLLCQPKIEPIALWQTKAPLDVVSIDGVWVNEVVSVNRQKGRLSERYNPAPCGVHSMQKIKLVYRCQRRSITPLLPTQHIANFVAFIPSGVSRAGEYNDVMTATM